MYEYTLDTDPTSTILIVDDNPAMRGALGKLLAAEGYNLAFASTGAEALSKATDLTPDLILMDVIMPDMDGLTACRRMRADPLLAEVPIIVLTALSDRASRLRGFEAGADDYVSKPVDDAELLARVRTTTRLNRYRRLLLEQIRRRQVEEALEAEREKELNCLFAISNLVEERSISLEAIFERVVNLMPPAWQYPEITCARLVFEDSEFETENFEVTAWKQASDIVVHGEPSGIVEVYYLKKAPESDEGPFLKEERSLINAIAERLGRVVERMQAEEAVREERDKAQRYLNIAGVMFVAMDTGGKVTLVNKKGCEVLGYDEREIVGKNWFENFIPERVRDQVILVSRKLLAGELEIEYLENPVLTKSGEERLISWHNITLRDEKGNITGHLASGEDITERKRVEEEVRRLNLELEQRVADRTRELQTLYNVTAIANESLEIEVVLEQALEQSLATVKCLAGIAQLLDEEGGALRLAAQRGLPARVADLLDTLPADGDSLSRWVIEQAKPLVVSDMSLDPRVPHEVRAHVPYPYIGVPMRIKGKVVGVFSMVGGEGQQFSANAVALLASIADHVAAAVENARLQRQAERAAVMVERGRLARELHDSVTQLLYSLSLFAETGRRLARAGEWQSAGDYLDQIGQTAQQALKEMRMLIHELRPPVLEQVGLVGALQRRLDAVERRTGVEASLLVEGMLELPVTVEQALYHIAQETLNNALRHAAAASVQVFIRAGDDHVELEVVDDGRGFDPDVAGDTGGIGLIGMRERVEELGGKLTVLSAPGEGTRVRVTIRTTEVFQ